MANEIPFWKLFLPKTQFNRYFQRKRYERKTRRWKQSSAQGWVSSILMQHWNTIKIYSNDDFIFQIMVNAALWQINAVHRLKFQNDFSSTFLVLLLSPFSSISPPFWPFHGLASLLFDIVKVRNSLTDYLYYSWYPSIILALWCAWVLWGIRVNHSCCYPVARVALLCVIPVCVLHSHLCQNYWWFLAEKCTN